jgi:membrane-associated phospholipid phosphatase
VSDEPFLAWPGGAHLRRAGWLALANAAWFGAVYGGADLLTARRALRVPVHFAAELRLPFVPAMALFYLSLYGLFLLAPFVLRTRRELAAAVAAMAVAIGVSGILFLLVPAELAFAPVREAQLGAWAGLYRLADGLNLTYNLLPSLHVAFAVICAAAFSPAAPRPVKAALWLWASLIAASTVLLHQHHLLDVAAGWLLAVACVRTVRRRSSRPLPSTAADRATSAARCPGTPAAPR